MSGLAGALIPNERTRIKNTNKLVGDINGLYGLKTGYYRVAGFNLAATARRDRMRLIGVVMGSPNQKCRFDVTRGVLEWGFATYGITPPPRYGRAFLGDRQGPKRYQPDRSADSGGEPDLPAPA